MRERERNMEREGERGERVRLFFRRLPNGCRNLMHAGEHKPIQGSNFNLVVYLINF